MNTLKEITGSLNVDGQNIHVRQYGHPGGTPIVYNHGFIGSGREAGVAHPFAEKHILKLIGIDRPGYGGSDFQKNRSLNDWPKIVECVMNALQIEKFHLLGMSGGGPYALVCAHQLHARALSTCIVASPSEFATTKHLHDIGHREQFFLWLAKNCSGLTHLIMKYNACHEKRKPGTYFKMLLNNVSPTERAFLEKAPIRTIMTESIKDVIKKGVQGLLREAQILGEEWGFNVSEIPEHHPVYILHGTKDKTIPFDMADELKKKIKHAIVTPIPDETHLMLVNPESKTYQELKQLYAKHHV